MQSETADSTIDASRLQFESLIADTSAMLIAAAPTTVDGAIEAALEQVRMFFGADRCGLLRVLEDQGLVVISHHSYGPGVPRVPGNLNLRTLFPWAYDQLRRGRPVRVERLQDLPPEAALDRATWTRFGARANLTVPIVEEGTLTHMVTLGALSGERRWPAEYVPRIRVLGEMMVASVARAYAIGALRAREADVQVKASRLEAAADAAGIGLWEWEADEGVQSVDERLKDMLGLEPGDERSHDLWLSRVAPESEAVVHEQRRQLLAGEVERVTLEYRYEHPKRGWIWLRRVVRRLPAAAGRDGQHLVAVVQDVSEARAREEALGAAHEQLNRLRARLERENGYLRKRIGPDPGPDVTTGHSATMRRALSLASQVAQTDTTVLITGETGTGKERFASFIHEASARRGQHMVRVNCSAIPSALIESELFGREKGAFTGALTRQLGRFELAHGSTLFLDEIGDLPLEVQVKLLRVLQERTLERLGSPAPVQVDVRIIAATHHDLEALVRAGTFRSDLFYRLNVFPIAVPPLRERREDVPALVDTLVAELSPAVRKRFTAVDQASLEALTRHPWPGNVRELRNVLERAMILSPGPTLHVDVPVVSAASPTGTAPATVELAMAPGGLQAWERDQILRVLQETGWRIRGSGGAAFVLNLKPTTLEKRMARLGIRRPSANA